MDCRRLTKFRLYVDVFVFETMSIHIQQPRAEIWILKALVVFEDLSSVTQWLFQELTLEKKVTAQSVLPLRSAVEHLHTSQPSSEQGA